jgi:phosphatidylserine decarboxylase
LTAGSMLYAALLGLGAALIVALPLAWKWRLGIGWAAAAVAALTLVSSLVVVVPASFLDLEIIATACLVAFLTLILALGLLLFRFYRDPERIPPEGDDVVVSPADGEVVYVRESRGGFLPVSTKLGRSYSLQELMGTPLAGEDAVVIGVGLSLRDVHVNRAPIPGRVTLLRRCPGRFGSLRRPEMVFENERATMLIEGEGLQVGIVLIASRLVRRIVSFVSEGQGVARGQRIGMIRFGSQVDVVLPRREDVRVTVQPGQRVTAAESVIAVLEPVAAVVDALGRPAERAGGAVRGAVRSARRGPGS